MPPGRIGVPEIETEPPCDAAREPSSACGCWSARPGASSSRNSARNITATARPSSAEAEAAEEVAARVQGEPRGLVRVSVPMGLSHALSQQLPGFLQLHPKLRVQLVIGNRRIDIIGERVDIASAHPAPPRHRLQPHHARLRP